MSYTDKTIEISKPNPNKNEIENANNVARAKFDLVKDGIPLGLQAGIAMAIYLFLIDLLGGGDIIALKFLKYAFLAYFLWIGLSKVSDLMIRGKVFRNGIKEGAVITFFSGIALSVVNLIAFLINPAISFEKFGVVSDSFGSFMVVSGAIFFEVLVFGLIITFIWLQILKTKSERTVI